MCSLIHLMPLVSFYIPWNHQKTFECIEKTLVASEAAFKRYYYKKVFWKYATILQENTHAEVWFQ